MSKKKVKTLRDKIISMAARRSNGVTAYEVATRFNVSRSSASAALSELANKGELRKPGTRRRVATGKTNIVYTA